MAVTRASLIESYPEFTNTPSAMVDAQIANAELMCDEDVYGTRYDLAVMLYACHLIASSPWGEKLKLQASNGETSYLLLHKKIEKAVGAMWRMPSDA